MAEYDHQIAELKKGELKNISRVKDCNFSDIILLQLFEGDVPIPNSYYFSNRRSYDKFNEFNRHEFYSLYTGSILLGEYKALTESSFAKINLEIMHDFEKLTTYKGLNVIKRKMKDIYNTDVIVVHDEKEFLMVKDANSKLWKAMLDGYQFLREGGCK